MNLRGIGYLVLYIKYVWNRVHLTLIVHYGDYY